MNKVIIIGEIGVNHNGSVEIAKRLIDFAISSKVDFVKFQTYNSEKLASKKAKKANYQLANSGSNCNSQFEMLKRLELSKEQLTELQFYCNNNNIGFLSTGFDEESIDFLSSLNIPFFKIPSGEITNLPLLTLVAKKGKPIILSTGMANIDEIRNALNILTKWGIQQNQITILHCNTDYPTQMSDVNLRAMLDIKKTFGVNVGYSDHTLGIEVPIAAVALGAIIIEKHFTLDRNMNGPDHAASLEPDELMAMVKAIRNIEQAISGSKKKEPGVNELKNRDIARKSIHLKRSIKVGEIISEDALIMKRPGDGISPMLMEEIIGKKAIIDLDIDHKLNWTDIG